ncbi:MAG: threonine synthase [Planctomycetes bacterium]|nr:threonine synthase [Planctomycetota bacterium]
MPPSLITGLRCVVCGRTYGPDVLFTCPSCGVEGILDVEIDYDRAARTLTRDALAARPLDHWRYRELLPIAPESPLPPLHVGWTPIYDAPRLARATGLRRVLLKDDGRNPTASFKDRASSVGVVKAREFARDTIACASTGNAASSLAGFAAAVGLKAVIFVPERAPDPKVAQLLIFGATVVKVAGDYAQAWELCQQACARWGWYNRNCAVNPYLIEGKKTAGLEIAEQCRDAMPDWVAFSVGDGCTIAGTWKGLKEMKRLGLVDRLPRMLGVQAQGAQPIVEAFRTRRPLVPGPAHSIADSISVGHPRNWRKALAAVTESGGTFVAVPDDRILDAMRACARLGGVFGEPAAAAALAGVFAARENGTLTAGDSALVAITGNGLKDVRTAIEATGPALTIKPDLAALAEALSL